MMQMTTETPILLVIEAADFCKGLEGFTALCRGLLPQGPRVK